jgi:hypothetical protein
MTIREYAKHRGVSHEAVRKAISSQRIRVSKEEVRGKLTLKFLDSEESDVRWEQRTDRTQQRVATRADMGKCEAPSLAPIKPSSSDQQLSLFPEEKPKQVPVGVGGQSKNAAGATGEEYQKNRGIREKYEALSAELDYWERVKKLADTESLQVKFFNLATEVSQSILNVPSRVSAIVLSRVRAYINSKLTGQVVEEIDEKEIQDIIAGELMLALERLSSGKAVTITD